MVMCSFFKLKIFFNSVLVALGLHCYEGVSLVAASRATLGCCARASHCRGLSCCRAWAPEHLGLFIARGHVESSQTRDQTHVPCIGRWILNHWTAREVLDLMFLSSLGVCLEIEPCIFSHRQLCVTSFVLFSTVDFIK